MGKTLQTQTGLLRTGLLAVAGAIVAGGIMMPTTASAQNLFDILFGAQPSPTRSVVAYAPDMGFDASGMSQKPQVKRVKLSPAIEKAVNSKPIKKDPPVAGKGPLGPFVNDPTLRAGDVVVTERGLMVYRGGGGSRHGAKDFVGIAKAGSALAGNKAALASIEMANRVAPAVTTAAAELPAVETLKQASVDLPRPTTR